MKKYPIPFLTGAILLTATSLALAQSGEFSGPSGGYPSSGPYISVAGGYKGKDYTQVYTSWGNSRAEADANARSRCRASGSNGCNIVRRASHGECLYIAARGKTWFVKPTWEEAAEVCRGLGPCEEEVVERCTEY